ncbi:probable ATP-dependent RNA helicase DDX28 [Callorhinchus milii]|uniref:probable ATP-dependent RNA helicase DDX28 n=1 Tax=Callorhinchus milii TaxID=7868 RepID=UPI001C3FADC3|nr:probable ATP-dependent RNA helicase DDX28 [Callorhinchus milii]
MRREKEEEKEAEEEAIPIIRFPQGFRLNVEQRKRPKKDRALGVRLTRPGRLLIQGRQPDLDQSARHSFGKFDPVPLVSKGWKHRKAAGDYFTINKTQSRPPVSPESGAEEGTPGENPQTFRSLGLCGELVEALARSGITRPTAVQSRTIAALMKRKNVLCAAETGSGKTLSYLLPLMHRLTSEDGEDPGVGTNAPRSAVLVPSRELADQVKEVACSLAAAVNLNVQNIGGGRGMREAKQILAKGPIDLLIATPGSLWKALRRNFTDLIDLRYLVLDEADTLFDESFAELLDEILHHTRIASNPSETRGVERKAQLVVVGATFPGGVGELLDQVMDLGSITTVRSKRLHHLMPHVKQRFVKVKRADKPTDLLKMLKELAAEKAGTGVLVFCNNGPTVNWLGYLLEDHGIKHSRLQGKMKPEIRSGIFSGFQKGLVDILLCTDIASRGLDTQRVEVVINYDFPASLCDYIHRAGRVGRVGSKVMGTIANFVTHPWDVELVQKIETAARRKTMLPGLESEISQPTPKNVPERT